MTARLFRKSSSLTEADLTARGWTYHEAFSRNLGLIDSDEQERLRDCRVAIAGMGGVGGLHLEALARLGIGKFRIADPDTFEVANFNRQYGADADTIGRAKADVMAERVLAINPEIGLEVLPEWVTPANIADFLDGVDVVLDGLDFFALDARRMLFREASNEGFGP